MGDGMGSTPHLPAEPGSQPGALPGAPAWSWCRRICTLGGPSLGGELRGALSSTLTRASTPAAKAARREPANQEPGRPSLPAPGRQGEEQRRRVRSWVASPVARGGSWSPDKGQVGAEGAAPQETHLRNLLGFPETR